MSFEVLQHSNSILISCSKAKEEQFLKKHDNRIVEAAQKASNEVEECLTLESARKRNHEMLKNLDTFKARFRSRATYSPVQSQLDKLKRLYKEKMEQERNSSPTSVPTSIKKKYGPTFV